MPAKKEPDLPADLKDAVFSEIPSAAEFCVEQMDSRGVMITERRTAVSKSGDEQRELTVWTRYQHLEVDFRQSRLMTQLVSDLEKGLAVYAQTATLEDVLRAWLQEIGREELCEAVRQGPPSWQPSDRAASPLPVRRRSAAPTLPPLPDLMKFPADRIHKGAVESLSCVEQWQPRDGFTQAHKMDSERKDFTMLCGFQGDPGPAVWNLLLTRGESAIKAHYALWARFYEETGAQPGRYVLMNINQFCRDLGYKEHHGGGFKRERKQEAMQILEALTSIEIAVRYRLAGKPGRIREVSGQLWQRGFRARERDDYDDLFGQAREGDPDLWDPAGFNYMPGPWFSDPEWRKQNEYLGLIGIGLMKLRTDTDQTAIRIGGYLGTIGRIEQFHPRSIRVETLLQRIGLANKYPRNPQRLQDNIEEAMNKLVEVAVVSRWGYTNADPTEPDMDDPEQLAKLAASTPTPWRRRVIEIDWPAPLQTEARRLETAEKKAIAAGRKRTRSKKSADTVGG